MSMIKDIVAAAFLAIVAAFLSFKRGELSKEAEHLKKEADDANEIARQNRIVASNPDTNSMRKKLSDRLGGGA